MIRVEGCDIAWIGWRGPVMREWSRGIEKLFPGKVEYYVAGNHDPYRDDFVCDCCPDTGTPADRTEYLNVECSLATLFDRLKDRRLVFYDSYEFSEGHRPEIHSFLPPGYRIFEDERWVTGKPKTVLVDGESGAGQFAWYREILPFFDRVFTTNPGLAPSIRSYPIGINREDYPDEDYPRRTSISFTGANLRRGYRATLCDAVERIPSSFIGTQYPGPELRRMSEARYVAALQTSRYYLSTYSCASGDRDPMCHKDKVAKALACGACPITEAFPDPQFQDGGRITFVEPGEIERILLTTSEQERKRVVEEGRRRVLDWSEVWKKFLEA